MTNKLVIFDYDDTLVSSSEYFFQLEVQVSENLGLTPATRDFYFELWGKPHTEMVETMHPEISLETYMEEYNRIYDPSNLALFEGALELITKLYGD